MNRAKHDAAVCRTLRMRAELHTRRESTVLHFVLRVEHVEGPVVVSHDEDCRALFVGNPGKQLHDLSCARSRCAVARRR